MKSVLLVVLVLVLLLAILDAATAEEVEMGVIWSPSEDTGELSLNLSVQVASWDFRGNWGVFLDGYETDWDKHIGVSTEIPSAIDVPFVDFLLGALTKIADRVGIGSSWHVYWIREVWSTSL